MCSFCLGPSRESTDRHWGTKTELNVQGVAQSLTLAVCLHASQNKPWSHGDWDRGCPMRLSKFWFAWEHSPNEKPVPSLTACQAVKSNSASTLSELRNETRREEKRKYLSVLTSSWLIPQHFARLYSLHGTPAVVYTQTLLEQRSDTAVDNALTASFMFGRVGSRLRFYC